MPERPSLDASRLIRRSHIFASAVRDVLEVDALRETTRLPLSLAQLHLMKIMCMNGERPLGQVAALLGVSGPAATKNVDKLERLGLVARTASAADRRRRMLRVSESGRRLVRDYEACKAGHVGAALAALTPDERERLSELLERFALSLLRSESLERGSCLRCAACVDPGCPIGRVRGGCPLAIDEEVS